MQGLVGTLPDMGSAVASKLRAFSAANTSLEQCRPNHLAALGSKNYTGKVRTDSFVIVLAVFWGAAMAVQGRFVAVWGQFGLFREYFGCSGNILAVQGLT